MAFTLFPKVVKFFELFRQQNRLIVEAAGCLTAAVNDPSATTERCQRVLQIEAEGNDIEREIFHQLADTFITPLDREDIQELNTAQEGLLNRIRAVSSRVGLYRFPEVRSGVKMLAEDLQQISTEIQAMVERLGALKEMEDHARRARKLRIEAATLLLVSLGELYEKPATTPADVLEVVQWSEVYNRLEQALDQAEVLANILERIGVKNA